MRKGRNQTLVTQSRAGTQERLAWKRAGLRSGLGGFPEEETCVFALKGKWGLTEYRSGQRILRSERSKERKCASR